MVPPPPSTTAANVSGLQPHQVTEDTPPDLLEGCMEILVVFPNEKSIPISIQRRMPMLDLLIHVTAANKLSPSSHVLQVSDGEQLLPYKPSTPIGSLNAHTVYIVPKSRLNDRSHNSASNNRLHSQPFEPTFRLKVHLPLNQLYVIRASPRTALLNILQTICNEKNLDINKYELRHPVNLDERLRLGSCLADYKLQEVAVVAIGKTATGVLSVNDLAAMKKTNMGIGNNPKSAMRSSTSDMGLNGNSTKKKRGFLGKIFGRKKGSSMGDSSISSDSAGDRSISPARSDDSPADVSVTTKSSSPTPPSPVLISKKLAEEAVAKRNSRLMMTQTSAESSVSTSSLQGDEKRPKVPGRQKKKQAPLPPVPTEHQRGGSEISYSSSDSTTISPPVSVIEKSEVGSDTSYSGHKNILKSKSSEDSVSLRQPTQRAENGNLRPLSTSSLMSTRVPSGLHKAESDSASNLTNVVSTSNVSLPSAGKKRKAPAPPPVVKEQPSEVETEADLGTKSNSTGSDGVHNLGDDPVLKPESVSLSVPMDELPSQPEPAVEKASEAVEKSKPVVTLKPQSWIRNPTLSPFHAEDKNKNGVRNSPPLTSNNNASPPKHTANHPEIFTPIQHSSFVKANGNSISDEDDLELAEESLEMFASKTELDAKTRIEEERWKAVQLEKEKARQRNELLERKKQEADKRRRVESEIGKALHGPVQSTEIISQKMNPVKPVVVGTILEPTSLSSDVESPTSENDLSRLKERKKWTKPESIQLNSDEIELEELDEEESPAKMNDSLQHVVVDVGLKVPSSESRTSSVSEFYSISSRSGYDSQPFEEDDTDDNSDYETLRTVLQKKRTLQSVPADLSFISVEALLSMDNNATDTIYMKRSYSDIQLDSTDKPNLDFTFSSSPARSISLGCDGDDVTNKSSIFLTLTDNHKMLHSRAKGEELSFPVPTTNRRYNDRHVYSTADDVEVGLSRSSSTISSADSTFDGIEVGRDAGDLPANNCNDPYEEIHFEREKALSVEESSSAVKTEDLMKSEPVYAIVRKPPKRVAEIDLESQETDDENVTKDRLIQEESGGDWNAPIVEKAIEKQHSFSVKVNGELYDLTNTLEASNDEQKLKETDHEEIKKENVANSIKNNPLFQDDSPVMWEYKLPDPPTPFQDKVEPTLLSTDSPKLESPSSSDSEESIATPEHEVAGKVPQLSLEPIPKSPLPIEDLIPLKESKEDTESEHILMIVLDKGDDLQGETATDDIKDIVKPALTLNTDPQQKQYGTESTTDEFPVTEISSRPIRKISATGSSSNESGEYDETKEMRFSISTYRNRIESDGFSYESKLSRSESLNIGPNHGQPERVYPKLVSKSESFSVSLKSDHDHHPHTSRVEIINKEMKALDVNSGKELENSILKPVNEEAVQISHTNGEVTGNMKPLHSSISVTLEETVPTLPSDLTVNNSSPDNLPSAQGTQLSVPVPVTGTVTNPVTAGAPASLLPINMGFIQQFQHVLDTITDPQARALQEEFLRLQQQFFAWQMQTAMQQPGKNFESLPVSVQLFDNGAVGQSKETLPEPKEVLDEKQPTSKISINMTDSKVKQEREMETIQNTENKAAAVIEPWSAKKIQEMSSEKLDNKVDVQQTDVEPVIERNDEKQGSKEDTEKSETSVYRYQGPPQVKLEPWKPGRPRSEILDFSRSSSFNVTGILDKNANSINETKNTVNVQESKPENGEREHNVRPSLIRKASIDAPKPFDIRSNAFIKRPSFVPAVILPVPSVQRRIRAPEVRGFAGLPKPEDSRSECPQQSTEPPVLKPMIIKSRLPVGDKNAKIREQLLQSSRRPSADLDNPPLLLHPNESKQSAEVRVSPGGEGEQLVSDNVTEGGRCEQSSSPLSLPYEKTHQIPNKQKTIRPISMPVSSSLLLAAAKSVEPKVETTNSTIKRRIVPSKFQTPVDPREELLKSIRAFGKENGLKKTGVNNC